MPEGDGSAACGAAADGSEPPAATASKLARAASLRCCRSFISCCKVRVGVSGLRSVCEQTFHCGPIGVGRLLTCRRATSAAVAARTAASLLAAATGAPVLGAIEAPGFSPNSAARAGGMLPASVDAGAGAGVLALGLGLGLGLALGLARPFVAGLRDRRRPEPRGLLP